MHGKIKGTGVAIYAIWHCPLAVVEEVSSCGGEEVSSCGGEEVSSCCGEEVSSCGGECWIAAVERK